MDATIKTAVLNFSKTDDLDNGVERRGKYIVDSTMTSSGGDRSGSISRFVTKIGMRMFPNKQQLYGVGGPTRAYNSNCFDVSTQEVEIHLLSVSAEMLEVFLRLQTDNGRNGIESVYALLYCLIK